MISKIQKQGPLIECVLNLSEGRDMSILDEVSLQINNLDGAQVIHRDIGIDAHRTVFTITGMPEAVFDSITEVFKIATQKIDMSTHHGAHPCTGALDVIPIIPIQLISKADCQLMLSKAAKKWSADYNVPICYYGDMSLHNTQSTLAQIRRGEYERLYQRIDDGSLIVNEAPQSAMNRKLGLSSCTVRDYMIAYNINLDTNDLGIAKQIASKLREMRKRKSVLKDVRFLAWYMEAYQCTQISTNIYDIDAVTMYELYQLIGQVASDYNVSCAGSELIGLTPSKGLTRNTFNFDKAVLALGLSSVTSFTTSDRILEHVLGLPTLH